MPDVRLCFHRALRSSANKLRRIYDAELAACGLRAHEFGLLSVVEMSGPLGIVELADRFLFDRATLRYKLAPMERAGLVEYVVDPRDRRSRRIGITAAGVAKLAEAAGPWNDLQARVEALLGVDEAAALRASADRVTRSPFPPAPADDRRAGRHIG